MNETMNKKIFYSKILGALILTYFFSQFLSKEVFLGYSPRIRPFLGRYLIARAKEIYFTKFSFFANLFYQKPADKLEHIPFKEVAKGIYAKSEGNVTHTLIKENEVEWVEYNYIIKGKKIKIKVPKGQKPLPKEFYE